MRPDVFVLLGPTASGKTAVSLPLAERLGADILCLDSRQIFAGMEIGTAQPTPAEQARVPHHLFGSVPPSERMSAGDFGRLARAALRSIEERGRRGLFVGGSGLYLSGVLGGLAEGLPHDPAVRERFRERARTEGTAALHAELERLDPDSAARLHPNDAQRVTRALEIVTLTGRPAGEAFGAPPDPEVEDLRKRTRIVILERPRAEIHARINARTRELLDGGMIEEVRRHLDAGLDVRLPVFRAHGYPEIASHLAGGMTRGELEARLATVTRNYAKRQETWFRKLDGAIRIGVARGEEADTVAERIVRALAGQRA